MIKSHSSIKSIHSILVWFSAIGFSITIPLRAQMLLPSLSAIAEKYPNFNPDFIKKSKIKSLTFDIMDKKDLEAPVDKGLIHHYEFDTNGLLSRFYYTVISKTIIQEVRTAPVYKRKRKISNGTVYFKNQYIFDTISTRFFYNDKGQLSFMRYNDGAYYEATYYDYDEDGNITKVLRTKETNSSPDKTYFQLGSQTILSDERFEYIKTGPNQLKKKCLNDEGRVFKEIIIDYNTNKQVVKTSENFTATWINQQVKYTYNDKGQLIEKIYLSNSNGNLSTKSIFSYDEKGNLLGEKQYNNETLLNEWSFLFDNSDQRVKSFIIRDYINKNIRITKVLPEFYDVLGKK